MNNTYLVINKVTGETVHTLANPSMIERINLDKYYVQTVFTSK